MKRCCYSTKAAAKSAIAGLVCLVLSACALPASGPTSAELMADQQTAAPPFAVVDVDMSNAAAHASSDRSSLADRFGTGQPRLDLRIAPGDLLAVSLWEAPPGTLFTSTIVGGTGTGTSGMVTIPAQSVGNDGTIGVPYVGRVRVVGLTAAEVERRIVGGLDGKAVQPQALVTIQKSSFNTVTVTGEVTGGALVPLSANGERVLDAIAAAGGLRASVTQSVVEVARGDRTARIPFEYIVDDPRENIFLRPADVVTVIQEPRTVTVLGATGRNAVLPFQSRRLSVAEALANAGGLQDDRADVSGVFLLRREPMAVAQDLLPKGSAVLDAEQGTPTVYHFNLHDNQTLLAMRQFDVQAGDVLYVSDATSLPIQKFFGIFSGIANPALSAAAIGASVH